MPNVKPRRVLPADVYDAMELGALVYGGIGGGSCADVNGQPLCAFGIAPALVDMDPFDVSPLDDELRRVGLGTFLNDLAVEAINARRGRRPNARVTFKQWARELGVVRGDQ